MSAFEMLAVTTRNGFLRFYHNFFLHFSDDQWNQCFSVRVNGDPRSSRFEGTPPYDIVKPYWDQVL